MADKKFKVVRMIYGFEPDAAKKYEFVPSGGMNDIIEQWIKAQDRREWTVASPSRITSCPRVIWLKAHNVPEINSTGWGIQQRLLLGRLFENQFATQLKDIAPEKLLFHWKDDPGVEVKRFSLGEGKDRLEGVPDYLLDWLGKPTVSDAKTSRSDSFGYVEIEAPKVWEDWGWKRYKIQLNGYYKLCLANKDWFDQHKLPLPEQCHLFSYALDDGIVRREYVWTPTQDELDEVAMYTRRFNEAIASPTMPACTCADTPDGFDVKFCDYGILGVNEKTGKPLKIATTCCADSLAEGVKNG